jgi:hypothetical protein
MLNVISGTLSAGAPAVPTSPVAGYVQWFDANDASTFTYSSGAVVSAWADKSGNSRNATQATVANQPSRVSSVINGKAVVRFDSTNDVLGWTAYAMTAQTWFFVFRNPSEITTATSNSLLSSNTFLFNALNLGDTTGAIANERITWIGVSTGGTYIQGIAQNTTNIPAGNHQLNVSMTSGYGGSMNFDKVAVSTANVNGGFAARSYPQYSEFLGNASGLDIAEVIAYDTALSAGDIATNESYLASKWGV